MKEITEDWFKEITDSGLFDKDDLKAADATPFQVHKITDEYAIVGDGDGRYVGIYKSGLYLVKDEHTAIPNFTIDDENTLKLYNLGQCYLVEHGNPYHEYVNNVEEGLKFFELLGYTLGENPDEEVKRRHELLGKLKAMPQYLPDTLNMKNINFSIESDDFNSALEYKLQRLERGFDDTETWNLYYTIAGFVLPRLKRFKEVTMGYPAVMSENEWNECLDKMIFAFETVLKEDDAIDSCDNEKVEEGLSLFAKHYFNLGW